MTDKIIVSIDASELEEFSACSFKWYAGHKLHLRTKIPNKNMQGGTLVHDALEKYYLLKRDTYLSQADIIEEVVQHTRMKALELETQEPGEVTDTIFQFREYCRYYENETWIPLYIEQPFIKLLHEDEEIKIFITGKPDLVFKFQGTNHIGICDHKKSSRNFDYSPLRNQFNLYAVALETDTVIVNKVGFQKSLALKDRMLRQTFVYHQELLDEWKQDTIMWVKKLVIANETGVFERNRSSCEKFQGCHLQQYCNTRPAAREFLIGNDYIIGETWDVTKVLEET